MLNNLFGSKTTASKPSNKAKMSQHLVRLSKDQSLNEKCQIQVVESFLQMRSKTYAETFFPYFRMATFLKFLSHPLSFVLSFPVAFMFLWVFAFGMEKDTILNIASTVYQDGDVLTFLVFAAALAIVSAVLFAFEWAQHVALATSYKMYYQTKKIEWPLVIVGIVFSIISIFLSIYGAQEIAEGGAKLTPYQIEQIAFLDASIQDAQRSRKATNTKDADLLKMKDRELSALRAEKYAIQSEAKSEIKATSSKLLGFALTNEGCIHFATFFIFLYMFKSSKEFEFINDLFRGRDYLGLNFLTIGSTLPDNFAEPKEASNVPNRAAQNQNTSTVIKMPEKQAKAVPVPQGKAVPQKQVEQVKNIVPTKDQAKKAVSGVGNFTKKEIEKYFKTYEKRSINSATLKARTDNKKRAVYAQYKLSTFDQEQVEGKVLFDIRTAIEWYDSYGANLAN